MRDLQKSPTVEDLVWIIGHPHAPQGAQRCRQLDVPRLENVPEPEKHRPSAVPDPRRPIPPAVYITRAMLERHGYSEGCQRCNATTWPDLWHRWSRCRLPQTRGGRFAHCRTHVEAALTQWRVPVQSGAGELPKRPHLAEEVEPSTKRRQETSEGSEGHVLRLGGGGGGRELKVTKKWWWNFMKRKRRHRPQKVANDPRKEGRVSSTEDEGSRMHSTEANS